MDTDCPACTLVAGALGLSSVTQADSMQTLGGWDSLGHMAIVAAIETATGVALTPEQIVSISSVADVARLLQGQR